MQLYFSLQEKDIVDKRIERMQRKVEGSPNVETMLMSVRELRKEREKVKELQTQKTEQRTGIGMQLQILQNYDAQSIVNYCMMLCSVEP